MPIIDLGKLKFHFAGSWSTITNYEKDDVVLHRQQTWVSLGDSYNQTPHDGSAFWERMTGGLNYTGTFDVSKQYFRNDMVKHGNAVFVAIVDQPPLGTQTSEVASWEPIGSWSGTAVTADAGDLVYRDENGQEKPLPAKIPSRGKPTGIVPDISNWAFSKNVGFAHKLKLNHSADNELENECKSYTHKFKVTLDDNDNPTGYLFYKTLEGASSDYWTEYEVRWNSTANKFEMREKLPQPAATTTTYTVTVSDASGSNKYLIDGVETPTLTLTRGSTYIFNQDASSNDTHQIKITDASDVDYTTGVTTYGTAGDGAAYTTFVVPMDAPDGLKYSCVTHGSGMGNTITVVDAIPFEQNKRLSIRRSGHFRSADINFHRLRFDVSHASMADDGQGGSNPIRLRFSTLTDGNHNSSATYTDRSALANDAYFIQSGTAPADDFTEELYAKEYTTGHNGTWFNNRLTYNGTPGTAGAFVELWFSIQDITTENQVFYFEEFNSGAGGIVDIGYELIGLNPALTLHRWHNYHFEVNTVGTSQNHPLYIKSQASLGTGDTIADVTNNGSDNATVQMWISNDTSTHPATMYYVSSFNNTTFTNTITPTAKVAAPSIIYPDNVILYDGVTRKNDDINAMVLYWDRYDGWREFKKLTLILQDMQMVDDTDQSTYVRLYSGPGNGKDYTLLSASYYYAAQIAYGATATQTQTYGNNTSVFQIVWDSGNQNREQSACEFDIYLTPKGPGNIYGVASNTIDNDSTNTLDGAQRYLDGSDRSYQVQWRTNSHRDNGTVYNMVGSGSLRSNMAAGDMITGVRVYSNSGNIGNMNWQLRGHR